MALSASPESAAVAPRRAAGATAVEELPGEVDPADEATWRGTIAGVNGRKRMLGAFLEESRFLGVAGGMVVLGMDDLHRAVVEEKDNRAMLMEELARAFGRPVSLRCVTGEGALAAPRPPALADVKPLVDQAIAFFDGEVIDPRRASERKGG